MLLLDIVVRSACWLCWSYMSMFICCYEYIEVVIVVVHEVKVYVWYGHAFMIG